MRRTIVVTGGASGIGRRAVLQLVAAGHRVVLVARSAERAAPVAAAARATSRRPDPVVVVPADLTRLTDVRSAVERIGELAPVHAVVNNAAVFDLSRTRARLTEDGIEETFAVNHVAHVALTTGLADAMTDDAVVVTAGSKGLLALPWLRLDPDDLDSRTSYRPTRAYYRSKLAQLAFTGELGRRGRRAVALRIPSVRADPRKIARLPVRLRLPYLAKARFAVDPTTIAASYVTLASGAAAASRHAGASHASSPHADPSWPGTAGLHVDEHGRVVPWPDDTADPRLGAFVWNATTEMITAAA